MLERVSAQAESAASLFIRNFERPYRSTRILDPRFWQNGNAEIAATSWWPSYLQHVRDVPQGKQFVPRDGSVTTLVPIQCSLRSDPEDAAIRGNRGHPAQRRRRCYTVSASTRQKPQRLDELFGLSEEILPEDVDEKDTHGVRGNPRDSPHSQHDQGWSLYDDTVVGVDGIGVEKPELEHFHLNSKNKARHNQKVDDWDLDSSFASLISPDRIVSVETSEDPTAIDSKTEKEIVDFEIVAPEEVQDDTQDKPADVFVGFETGQKAKDPVIEIRDDTREALHRLLQYKGAERDFDEVWRLFSLTDNQELDVVAVFRYLAKAKHPQHLNRAAQAYTLIPEKQRTGAIYHKALNVQLSRYKHREAVDLAFEAQAKNIPLVPTLLRHFVGNLLWNSAVELIRRNGSALQDVQNSVLAIKRQAVGYNTLVASCQNMSDLFAKVTSLAGRLRDNDATILHNRSLLEGLCKSLILRCAWSTEIAGKMTREGIVALIELGISFGVRNIHRSILSTLFRDVHKADKAALVLFVYRNYRLNTPDEDVTPRTLGSLLSICGTAKSDIHVYGFLLNEFEKHCTQAEIVGAFQRVLTYCARQGQVDAVEHFLQDYILKYGATKNPAMLNPLIHVRAVSGDVTGVNTQFGRLRSEFGIEPNSVSWNILLLAHARSTDDLSAFDIFDEMLTVGIEPDPYTYGTLLSICAKHADAGAAINLLEESRKMNVPVTVPMICSVVEAYLANDDDKQALAFVHATTESGTTESPVRLWNSLMRYYAFRGDTAALIRTRGYMTSYGVKPNDWTYASLMIDLVSRKKTREAIQLLRDMHFKDGMPVTLLHYSIILQGLIAERQRDTTVVILSEIRQRFPSMATGIDAAMMSLRNPRRYDISTEDTMSVQLDILSNMLVDVSSQSDTNAGVSATSEPSSTEWLPIFESLVESLIRNRSYEQAELLLTKLTAIKWSKNAANRLGNVSSILTLSRMDLAIARGRWDEVHTVWQGLFQDAKRRHQPLGVSIRQVRQRSNNQYDVDQNTTRNTVRGKVRDPEHPTQPVLKKWQFSLSSPLNRYITSMGNAGRIDELWQFIRDEFKPAGFELSGRNWNRYIQILCGSPQYQHQSAAFKLTEKHFINRAQSWELMTSGLLRLRTTTYSIEANKPGKRPVFEKRNSFAVSDRSRFLLLQPSRKIPTYLTFVHLAKLLQQIQQKAQIGSNRFLMTIGRLAPKTKKFLQNMPYLRDRFQGTILRDQPARPDDEPRPRSELTFRELADRRGVLGSSSPLDHLPAEFVHDIEALVAPTDDLRQTLRRDQDTALSPRQERDILVGERFEGQVNRRPIVLASKGRLETREEYQKRVTSEERQKLDSVTRIRQDIRTRHLFRDSHRGREELPVIGVNEALEVADETLSTETYSLPLAQVDGEKFQPLAVSSGKIAESSADEISVTRSEVLFYKLSVPQQLERLEAHRNALAERARSKISVKPGDSLQGLAIPYANTRRVRRALIVRQVKQTLSETQKSDQRKLLDSMMEETFRVRKWRLRELARERRAVVLRQERELRVGRRLQPMPKTWRAINRSRSTNLPPIRFVADLNRTKWRIQVRRGLMPDWRIEKFKNAPEELKRFISAEEMIKRRHPVLTALQEADPTFGRRKIRRREVVALSVRPPKPTVSGNFEPISEIPKRD